MDLLALRTFSIYLFSNPLINPGAVEDIMIFKAHFGIPPILLISKDMITALSGMEGWGLKVLHLTVRMELLWSMDCVLMSQGTIAVVTIPALPHVIQKNVSISQHTSA